MAMEQFINQVVIPKGGLNTQENFLELARTNPGAATDLINMEPSLYGGYRRLSGFTDLEENETEVDSAGAEGAILGVAIFNGDIYAARKQQSSTVYAWYKWNVGTGWTKQTTGLTLTATGVGRIRYATFNLDGTPTVIFVDGVNNATLFDGTNWTNIDPSGTGADFANAGGGQALAAPKYVTVYKNHIFMSGDSTNPHLVAHSAPNIDYDWTSASGAGQLIAGFDVAQIYPHRQSNYIFGASDIKKIEVDSSGNFVINDVTKKLGCIASDSVIEINGDLLFLSQDGIRPLSATERLNDVEIASVSKQIQSEINRLAGLYNDAQITATVVRKKSQVRFFFASSSTTATSAPGIIGAIVGSPQEHWEWGKLRGIKVACTTSDYIGRDEYVIHGGYDGHVYQQEEGNSFGGSNIVAKWSTPWLDFGDPSLRKTMRRLKVFSRPEGSMELNIGLTYDWSDPDVINPSTYTEESTGSGALYGTAVWDTGEYGGATVPISATNIQGSGFSVRFTFVSDDTNPSYTIQALAVDFDADGKK